MQPLRLKIIMHPLKTKKLRNLSGHKESQNLLGQKKILQPFGGKIMQPFRTKKSCNLPEGKKKRNFSGQKIRQPFGARSISGGKNQATSWDKKNHAASQNKKIMQPLRTKKSCNLPGQKNHATSQANNKYDLKYNHRDYHKDNHKDNNQANNKNISAHLERFSDLPDGGF